MTPKGSTASQNSASSYRSSVQVQEPGGTFYTQIITNALLQYDSLFCRFRYRISQIQLQNIILMEPQPIEISIYPSYTMFIGNKDIMIWGDDYRLQGMCNADKNE